MPRRETAAQLLKSDLKCYFCGKTSRNMPTLKDCLNDCRLRAEAPKRKPPLNAPS